MSVAAVSSARKRARWTSERGRMPLFYAITAVFLAFLLFAFNEPLRFTYLAWTPGYEAFTHRVHHVTIGAFLAILVVGVAAQLYRPAARVGAYLLAASATVSYSVVTLVVEGSSALAELAIFLVPLGIIGVLHPGLRSFRPSRESIDGRLLALGVVAAVPLVAFAALQLNLQLTMADDHAGFIHYLMMAAGTLTIGLGAILASARPAGWRTLVYGVAALAALIGVASVVFPATVQGVNFGVLGGTLAVLWAIGFVAVAEYGAREPLASDPDGSGREWEA